MKLPAFLTRSITSVPASAPSAPVVAVSGALRCGTNYLKFLLENNYGVTASFSPFGWKHAGVPVFAPDSGLNYPDTALCYIVKNPYAFVVSLHKYSLAPRVSILGGQTFDRFLTEPIVIFDSQLKESPQLRFANPVQYWNHIYWNLETLSRDRFTVHSFNYEELIGDPGTLGRVEKPFGLKREPGEWKLPRNSLKKLAAKDAKLKRGRYESEDAFDVRYYLDERYLEQLSGDQTAFISRQVDPWLMERRGYRII